MDLDEFKAINDTHGHAAGDQVLKTVARRLLDHSRADDTVSRYGGDEFLHVLMQVTDVAHVAMIAEKIGAAVSAPCEFEVDGVTLRLAIHTSIGIAVFPDDGETTADLVTSADKAMYRAKRGRLGYAFAEPASAAAMAAARHGKDQGLR